MLSRRVLGGYTATARKAFADALLGMATDGTVARIYGKYVGEPNGRALVPERGRRIVSAYRTTP